MLYFFLLLYLVANRLYVTNHLFASYFVVVTVNKPVLVNKELIIVQFIFYFGPLRSAIIF